MKYIKDEAKLAMLNSLVDLEGDKGRIYEMTYTADYKLEDALNADTDSVSTVAAFVAKNLLDVPFKSNPKLSYSAGCSAFACPDTNSGNFIMGRNFDFNHIDPVTHERTMIPAIVVHTAPAGGKKSVSFVDGLFANYKCGFFTDGSSDLSLLIALPYLLLDGINEDGLAVSVLKLDGLPTRQHDPGKKKIFTTVALRMVLDRASTVKEAIEMLKHYNMCMDKDPASYHFFMADALGDFAIIEYTNNNTDVHPDTMEVLTGDDALRYVTNFYLSPSMADTPHGRNISTHGKNRYEILRDRLADLKYKASPAQAFELLQAVSQGPDDDQSSTGFTQWSQVYNLNEKTVTMSILREWNKQFIFHIK